MRSGRTFKISMKIKQLILTAILLAANPAAVSSAEPASDSTVVSHIEDGNRIVINCPDNLLQRLAPAVPGNGQTASDEDQSPSASATQPTTRVGYRVLVFDDNDVRTAKQNAQARRNQIVGRFPELNAYIQFNSPYWRVKVGDFKTRSEAEAAMQAIRAAFPGYGSQLRVVRDRINH